MAEENKKEKITLEDLAREMRGGFASVDVKIKESEKRIIEVVDSKIDELAMITKHGFDSVGERFDKMDERFERVDERFDKMDEKLDDLDKSNNQAHENTSLRLNEVAYSFELVALKKRVDVLEEKATHYN